MQTLIGRLAVPASICYRKNILAYALAYLTVRVTKSNSSCLQVKPAFAWQQICLDCRCLHVCFLCSPGGVKDFSRVIYQNGACKKAFGLPRPIPEYTKLFKQLPDEDLQLRRDFMMKALKVQVQTRSSLSCQPAVSTRYHGLALPLPRALPCQVIPAINS